MIAVYLGYDLLRKSWPLKQEATDKQLARSLLKFSILYMMLLRAAMVVDT